MVATGLLLAEVHVNTVCELGVVPVVSTQLEGDISKIRRSIITGTSIPLLMFLLWNMCILGGHTTGGLVGATDFDPLLQLQNTSSMVSPIIQAFSLVAIASSYVGFVLGLTDFLADALNLRSGNKETLPYVLTITPPLCVACTYPDLFLSALKIAGTYGVMVLFGMMPAAMAYVQR